MSDITLQDPETQRPPSIQMVVFHLQAQAEKQIRKHRHRQGASESSILMFFLDFLVFLVKFLGQGLNPSPEKQKTNKQTNLSFVSRILALGTPLGPVVFFLGGA